MTKPQHDTTQITHWFTDTLQTLSESEIDERAMCEALCKDLGLFMDINAKRFLTKYPQFKDGLDIIGEAVRDDRMSEKYIVLAELLEKLGIVKNLSSQTQLELVKQHPQLQLRDPHFDRHDRPEFLPTNIFCFIVHIGLLDSCIEMLRKIQAKEIKIQKAYLKFVFDEKTSDMYNKLSPDERCHFDLVVSCLSMMPRTKNLCLIESWELEQIIAHFQSLKTLLNTSEPKSSYFNKKNIFIAITSSFLIFMLSIIYAIFLSN